MRRGARMLALLAAAWALPAAASSAPPFVEVRLGLRAIGTYPADLAADHLEGGGGTGIALALRSSEAGLAQVIDWEVLLEQSEHPARSGGRALWRRAMVGVRVGQTWRALEGYLALGGSYHQIDLDGGGPSGAGIYGGAGVELTLGRRAALGLGCRLHRFWDPDGAASAGTIGASLAVRF